MDLCQWCRSITFAPQESDEDVLDFVAILHPTLAALESSASKEICRFCVTLSGMIQHRSLGKPFEHDFRGDRIELSISYLEDGDWMSDEMDSIQDEPEALIFKHPLGVDAFVILNASELSRSSWNDAGKDGMALMEDIDGRARNLPDNPERLDTSTGSDQALLLASSWVQRCQQNHTGCRQPSSASHHLPARLINVSRATSKEGNVFLVCFNNQDQSAKLVNTQYATLSHRWDPNQSCMTTSGNQKTHIEEGLLISQLPKTFAEACITTNKLGIEYIWIDSLCIIQDSVADKLVEIPKMAVYYQNAEVNISASTANIGGLWAQRTGQANKPLTLPITINIPGVEGKRKEVILSVAPVLRGPRSHLDSRGWILQERIFPRRTLFFDPYWISFQCAEWSASENCPQGFAINAMTGSQERENKMGTHIDRDCGLAVMGGALRNIQTSHEHTKTPNAGLAFPQVAHNSAYLLWYRIVKEYSQRQLSFETDRLLAIAGLAERLSSQLGDEYIGGMWKADLLRCFQWTPTEPAGYATPRVVPYRAPTWSWMSLDMAKSPLTSPFLSVIYDQGAVEEEVSEATVVNVDWGCRTANIYGDLSHATLVLKGRLLLGHAHASVTVPDISSIFVTMKDELDDVPPEEQYLHRTLTTLQNEIWYVHVCGRTRSGKRGWVVARFNPDVCGQISEGKVYLLPISRRLIGGAWDCFCLLLKEVADGKFERVGWTKSEPRFMPRGREQVVTIV